MCLPIDRRSESFRHDTTVLINILRYIHSSIHIRYHWSQMSIQNIHNIQYRMYRWDWSPIRCQVQYLDTKNTSGFSFNFQFCLWIKISILWLQKYFLLSEFSIFWIFVSIFFKLRCFFSAIFSIVVFLLWFLTRYYSHRGNYILASMQICASLY